VIQKEGDVIKEPGSLQVLEQKLGYQFKQHKLLKQALTHRSFGASNNERLEFLGDAILTFVIADALYERFPTANEGQLSRLRARLVRGQTLAEIAREKTLGTYLIMGSGELKTGGFARDSILSDALEAIIGAVYQDSGIETATKMMLLWFEERLDNLSLENSQKDSKTRLQEFLQARKAKLPGYEVTKITGKAPDEEFEVECRTELLKSAALGKGGNRRIAEQMAATRALELLGVSEEEASGG
jgi:ribonuclease-3